MSNIRSLRVGRSNAKNDAGFGVCMDNGRDDVKAVSDKVSPFSNDEDGVGREIELLLEQGAFD